MEQNIHLIHVINEIGGKQQESKLHIKLHMNSNYISPYFFSILKPMVFNPRKKVMPLVYSVELLNFSNLMKKKVYLHDETDQRKLIISAFLSIYDLSTL